jgi:hypothetical protein
MLPVHLAVYNLEQVCTLLGQMSKSSFSLPTQVMNDKRRYHSSTAASLGRGRKPFALDIKPQIKSNVPVDTVAGGAPRLDLTEQRKRRLLSAGASSLLLLPLRN